MKILLFMTSVQNTLTFGINVDYKYLVENLNNIKKKNNSDICYVGFFDETLNRDIIMYHIRRIVWNAVDKNIYMGKQFLGDVYYNNENSGAILYNNKLNKYEEIVNYIKELKENGNEVKVIIVDGNMNNDYVSDLFNKNNIDNYTLINDTNDMQDVNDSLEKLSKKKSLRLT